MKTDYDNAYFHDNVYGHVVELLAKYVPSRSNGAVHLDIGCGYGRIAEPLQAATGSHYIGLDLDTVSVSSLCKRNLEAHIFDLRGSLIELKTSVEKLLGGRQIASISLIDVLEHIAEPATILNLVRELITTHGAIFILSVPNIAHRDVGFKLATGRYDVRATGLLDYTHVHGFTEKGLIDYLGQFGLYQTARNDVRLEHSDQAFPFAHPALSGRALLGAFLRNIRDGADATATVNQFVMMCLPGPVQEPAHLRTESDIAIRRPFLSVITRTQGRRPATLRDALLALAAQTCDDFEVVVVGHKLTIDHQLVVERLIEDCPQFLRDRIRLIRVERGNRTAPLNEGFAAAKGKYIAILDDDDLPMAHWVETFKMLANDNSGCVLRTVAIKQEFDEVYNTFTQIKIPRAISGFIKEYPSTFNWMDHLRINRTPPIALAFPRAAFTDLNIRFDESLTTTEDWDYLMRIAPICGVASSPSITCIYRWWKGAENSQSMHSQEEWRTNHFRIFNKMDQVPTLLPAGFTKQLRDLIEHRDHLVQQLIALQAKGNIVIDTDLLRQLPTDQGARTELTALLTSRSWRISAPLRWAKRVLRGLPSSALDVASMSPTAVTEAIRNIRESSSWKITAPLRKLGNWSRAQKRIRDAKQ
ncbi:MAG: glycosyltransferase [Nitrosomonas sp.]|nr:glycosyltransferase [Nitrosomonas sp.]MDL1866748.1 glycosyltransferase [Betaproteobacteria bacterium PRO4]